MDFKQLRAFLTVAETGNVTRAAELLNLVQPAVSRQLRLLEEDVGAELFERERHGMVLTEAGQALVGYARRAMLELDRARAEIGGAANGIGGLVTVGLLPSTCELLSSPLVRAVAAQLPRHPHEDRDGLRRDAAAVARDRRDRCRAALRRRALAEIQTTPLIEEALWVVGAAVGQACAATGRCRSPAWPGKPLVLPSAPAWHPDAGGPCLRGVAAWN